MRIRTRAHLALFTVNLIYGANYAVAKSLMPAVIGPAGFILVRVIGASVLFWLTRSMMPERVEWSDMPRLALCGLFGVALNQLLFFQGLMRTSPVHASIIMVATPMIVLALSGLLIGERITRSKVLGIALGAAGALLLLGLGAQHGQGGSSPLGDAFVLLNAISFGLFLVVVKPLMRKYSAVTVMAWSFVFGLVPVFPMGLSEALAVDWAGFTWHVWLSVLFVVIMVTFVAYLLNTWALRHVEPSVVGTHIYFQPMMAVGFAWAYVRFNVSIPGAALETPVIGPVQVLAALAIFGGVYLVGRRSELRS
ncbi:MAG: DMT family transporter [Flavobacteriales bacterium]|nr:DMT family transporter [Flavobacteriales bacterium]